MCINIGLFNLPHKVFQTPDIQIREKSHTHLLHQKEQKLCVQGKFDEQGKEQSLSWVCPY